ncbi:hypothetical protein [Methylobacillus sp.]|nr:hypothetical protein [Methylobacillus sp.]
MKTLKMKVLWVDSESITFPEPTYEIKVDNPEIDKYMIDHWLFDIVEPGS